jgi:hypothetical protein
MPGKVYTYPDGSKVEIHKDGSFTITGPKGDPVTTFDKKGNCTIKKKGFPPKVVKGEEKKKGRKWVFEIDGKTWVVTIRDNEVEIEKKDNQVPPNVEETKVDKKTGKKTVTDKPNTGGAFAPKDTEPSEAETIQDDPSYDPIEDTDSGGGGGGNKKGADKKKPKKKVPQKGGKKGRR